MGYTDSLIISEKNNIMAVTTKTFDAPKHKGYKLVVETIKEKIANNEWQPGYKIPPERELEKTFGLSRLTISKGLANLASEGLVVRKQGQGTFVADNPRKHIVHKRLIKYISPIGSEQEKVVVKHGVLEAMYDVLASKDYYVGVDFYRTTDELINHLRRDADIYHGGFIVWYAPDDKLLPEIKRLKDANYPVVLLDAYPADFDIDYVVTDNIFGAEMVVEYLYSLGHRHIAYITRKVDRTSLQDRQTGFLSGLVKYNLPIDRQNIIALESTGKQALQEVISAVDKLINQPNRPSAIFFANDDLALISMEYLKDKGIRVPDDISIVGYDNIDRCEYSSPPLTTVSQNFYKIGREASSVLLERLENRLGSRTIQLSIKPELIIRSSCKRIVD